MSGDLLKYHQWCVSDPIAMSAYEAAIRKTVRPGDVVLDLGAGTGILSYMACQAGAERVYAVEPTDIVALIPQLAADNGFSDRIVWKRATSFHVELSEKADVMIASMFGSAGIGTNMLDIVIDARDRLLKPGGAIIPLSIEPVFCPVELRSWYATNVECWSEPRNGFTFGAARSVAVNQTAAWKIGRADLLAVPQSLGEVRLAPIRSSDMSANLVFPIERNGTIHALTGWIQIVMAEGIRCGSSPLDPTPMPWDQLLLPLELPVSVSTGDHIHAVIRTATAGSDPVLTWDIRVTDSGGDLRAEFHQSTFQGVLLTKEDLAKRASNFAPTLSESAKAELAILQLCNGERTLDEIAAKTLECFPRVMGNLKQARKFAAEVLGRHTNDAD